MKGYANVAMDVDTDSSPTTTDEPVLTVTHSSDHFLLSAFCLLSLTNQALWISFASVKDDVEKYFALSDPLLVDLFSNVYMFVFLVLFLPSAFFLNNYGLKTGIVVSASLNATGAMTRYFFAVGHNFLGCLLGQSFCAVSQVMNFCCVGALASSVVKPELKGRAIGLIWFATYFGVAMGLWIPPIAIGDSSDDLVPCLLGFGITALLVWAIVMASVYQGSRKLAPLPSTSTPAAASTPSTMPTEGNVSASDFGNEIFALFHNKQYMLLTLGFGCGMGGAYAVATDINSLFAEAMAKDSDIGVLGLFFSLFAALGVLLVGVLLTARPKWRETHRLSVGMSAVACVAMLGNVIGVASQSTGLIFLCTLIYGFSVTALNASCLEFGQFVSNGSEFVVNGSMMAAVQLFGIFLTATTGMITAPDDRRKGDTGATIGALFFLMFTQTVATGLIWASSKVLPVDGNNGGAGGVARRRVSSTNKTVSLIDNEETVTAVADVAVHAADGASEGVDVL